MNDKIKEILKRRGALHTINGTRFYTEDSLNSFAIEICEEQKKQCRHSVLVKIDSNLVGANKVLDFILNSKNIAE